MDVEEDAVDGEEDDVGLEGAELRAGVEGGGDGDDGVLLGVVDDGRAIMGLLLGMSSGTGVETEYLPGGWGSGGAGPSG